MAKGWRRFWTGLRAVTGDDAYERYLAHHHLRHPESVPLDRGAFYASELDRRWKQVSRCC
jgi:uncharacterized short protein YbdD (DUF466 family)